MSWNNQQAVPELQGGRVIKGAKCSVGLEDKEGSQERRAGRLQREEEVRRAVVQTGWTCKVFKERKRSLSLICKKTRKEQDGKSLQMYLGWNEKSQKAKSNCKLLIQILNFIYKIPIA